MGTVADQISVRVVLEVSVGPIEGGIVDLVRVVGLIGCRPALGCSRASGTAHVAVRVIGEGQVVPYIARRDSSPEAVYCVVVISSRVVKGATQYAYQALWNFVAITPADLLNRKLDELAIESDKHKTEMAKLKADSEVRLR
jgi:hypothetical protein